MPSPQKAWYVAECEPVCLTDKYMVYFMLNPQQFLEPRSINVNHNHKIFAYDDTNVCEYEKFVQKNMFKGTGEDGFVNHAMLAVNRSISDLHVAPSDANDSGQTSNKGIDKSEFMYCGRMLCTRDDMMRLLFGPDSPRMKAVQEKRCAEAIAQVLKFASTITTNGAD